MNSGRLQASLDRVEAIVTHSDPEYWSSKKKKKPGILAVNFAETTIKILALSITNT